MIWEGHVARIGNRISAYGVLVGKPEGKIPFGGHRRRWEYKIKVDVQEVGWGAWSGLIWLGIGTDEALL